MARIVLSHPLRIQVRLVQFVTAAGQSARVRQSAPAVGRSILKTLIKEPLGNAQLFRLARRDLFLKQEWTLPSSTVSKKVKQNRQTE